MKVGDLVAWRSPTWAGKEIPLKESTIGLIVETGKFAGNGDVRVLWNRGIDCHEPHVHNSKFLKLVTSS